MSETDGEARFWNRFAPKYAASRVEDPPAYERTLEATRSFLSPHTDVFEFGCGTGTTALKLAADARHIVATDLSREMIAIARERARAAGVANVAFEVARPESERPGESYDVAIGFNVLHLVPNREEALAGVARLLKPGGHVITKTPCLAEMGPALRIVLPLMRMFGRAPHVDFFSVADLERQIAAAGFEIVLIERHGTKGRDIRPFIVARKP